VWSADNITWWWYLHYPVVYPSVTLCKVALRADVRKWKLHVPICPFRHFCCMIYRLATKCTGKKGSKKTRTWVFWDTNNHAYTAWFVAWYLPLRTEKIYMMNVARHAWVDWVWCFHKLYPEESDCVPAYLVIEIGLIVRSTIGYHSNSSSFLFINGRSNMLLLQNYFRSVYQQLTDKVKIVLPSSLLYWPVKTHGQ